MDIQKRLAEIAKVGEVVGNEKDTRASFKSKPVNYYKHGNHVVVTSQQKRKGL